MQRVSFRLWSLLAVLAVTVLSAYGPLVAPDATHAQSRHHAHTVYAYALGDSIMEGAAGELARRGIAVNAVKGRQFYQGIAIVQGMRASRTLPQRLVIGLGTNGPFTPGQFTEMMQALRGVRRVVFVTVKEPLYWESQVNGVIRSGVRRWPNARIADWYAYAAGHPAIVCCDGMHIGPAGARAYAQIVAAALR